MTDSEKRGDQQDLPRDQQDLPRESCVKETVQPTPWICPEFAFARIFSSHMILQRDSDIHVWGFSRSHGTAVTVTLGDETCRTTVDETGRWDAFFSPRGASFVPITMTASDRQHTVTLTDILIGDVWLIGGQSNSELTLSRCMEETPDLVFSETNGVRLFSQGSGVAKQDKGLCVAPRPDIVSDAWCWKVASREASYAHSALGWYFTNELIGRVNVPQGSVMMCAGGASIFDLAPAEYAHERGVFQGGMTCEGGLFNTLIHPLIGLAFAGQIFFQGESEGCSPIRASMYDRLLADFVADERKRFGFDFPFYNVQLSSYGEEGAKFFHQLHVVRMKQFDALSLIPHSTLTPDFDLGALPKYDDWAHSTLKQELGRRVAAVVLAEYYGIGDRDTAHAPMPASVTETEGGYRIVFRGAGDGMTVWGSTPDDSIGADVTGFSLLADGKYTPTTARLTAHDTVLLDAVDGIAPTHVAYAFIPTVTPENANLYRVDGVPPCAFTFKIEK